MSSPKAGDMLAGFIGLAVVVLVLLATIVVIVELTNQKFERHEEPAATAAH